MMVLHTESAQSISKGLRLLANYDILEFKAHLDEIYLRVRGHIPIAVQTKLQRLSWIIVDTANENELEYIFPLI